PHELHEDPLGEVLGFQPERLAHGRAPGLRDPLEHTSRPESACDPPQWICTPPGSETSLRNAPLRSTSWKAFTFPARIASASARASAWTTAKSAGGTM